MSQRPVVPARATSRGLALVDVAVAAGVLAIAMLGITAAARTSLRALTAAKETELARLAMERVRSACAVERIRAADAADAREWLFRGGYEIARAADGSSFAMPDMRTSATVTEGGVGGAVVVEFPVPPLPALAGRAHAGRLALFVDERALPAALPSAAFPLAPLPGLSRFDGDGDGLATTADLRQADAASAHPCRLVPGKVEVAWRGADGSEGRVEAWFLLGYPGHD